MMYYLIMEIRSGAQDKGQKRGGIIMNIKLTAEEEQIVTAAATEMAAGKNITPEAALVQMLGLGLNCWQSQQTMRRRMEHMEQERFNPFAVGRGE